MSDFKAYAFPEYHIVLKQRINLQLAGPYSLILYFLSQYLLGGACVCVRAETLTDRGYSQKRAEEPVLRKHARLGQEDIMREKRQKMMSKPTGQEERISNSVFYIL